MKKSSLLFILFVCALHSNGQNTTGTTDVKNEKKTDQYVGLQLNSLIREVFNFNSPNYPVAVTPYWLTYSVNWKKSGWGLHVGVGANYGTSYTDNGNSQSSTDINDFRLRVGVEKAYALSGKWGAGVGFDLLFNNNNDATTTTGMSYDTTAITNKTLYPAFGGGVMGFLRYAITPRIFIGTEASAYYTTGTETSTVDQSTIYYMHRNFPTHMESISKPKISHGTINMPIAFYLSVKF